MPTFQSPNGQITPPHQVTQGSLITVNPGVGASVTLEYTLSSRIDIQNRVASWYPWTKGAVTSSAQDLVAETLHVRSTSIGGADSSFVTEQNPTPQQLQAYKTAFGAGGANIVVSSAAPNNADGRPDGTIYIQTAP